MATNPHGGPWEHPKRWSPKQSIEERHVHKGEEGNRETPSHKRKPTTTNSEVSNRHSGRKGTEINVTCSNNAT